MCVFFVILGTFYRVSKYHFETPHELPFPISHQYILLNSTSFSPFLVVKPCNVCILTSAFSLSGNRRNESTVLAPSPRPESPLCCGGHLFVNSSVCVRRGLEISQVQ